MEKIILKRKINRYLDQWAKETKINALFLAGPRRTGKTTAAVELGKRAYSHYLILDFSSLPDEVKACFDSLFNLDAFFNKLFFQLAVPPLPRGSLIIFDEIQFCPKARQAIKHLVADGRYDYIETGSAISILKSSTQILLPSEERTLEVGPLDFEEFLWNIGFEMEADQIRACSTNRNFELLSSRHKELCSIYRLYVALGGMPSVVAAYIQSHDFRICHELKKDILSIYRTDLLKIDESKRTSCFNAFSFLPKLLARDSYRFPLSTGGLNPRSAKLAETLVSLSDSGIVKIVKRADNADIGFELFSNCSFFKAFYSDTGLAFTACYQSETLLAQYRDFANGNLRGNFGYLYENALALALFGQGVSPYYFSWTENEGNSVKSFEVDFAFERYGKIQPIECKSSGFGKFASLTRFESIHRDFSRRGIVFSFSPYKIIDGREFIPFYSVFCAFDQ